MRHPSPYVYWMILRTMAIVSFVGAIACVYASSYLDPSQYDLLGRLMGMFMSVVTIYVGLSQGIEAIGVWRKGRGQE